MIEEYVASKAMFNPNVIYLIRRYKIIGFFSLDARNLRCFRARAWRYFHETGNLDNNGKVAKNFSSSLEVEPSSERIVTI